ncbi:uncharacterized protein LOC128755926 [Synchiropus splendidus]|uniref:uncharacterized protein LOC128755926 n=1 Tax=Synchiropus splendidus TaxID=270530 RepID=UPI00237E7A67|nr:uncharacterized protein LOC128755926 [Synchiropus splendidus]
MGVQMECHDRYFMIAVDLTFSGNETRFEAVDRTGVHRLDEQYAAKCGYTIGLLEMLGRVQLRASYFSCHTENKDDVEFNFSFNLIVPHDGEEMAYSLNKTCSPSLPWSPREVTCETNFMEVSVRSEMTCPTGTRTDDWNDLRPAHGSKTSDWQVMFRIGDEQQPSMTLSEARRRGYIFDMTHGRLVLRTPYGQPDSSNTLVNGVPIEVVHATLFSRQSWIVLMVDLEAACSLHEGLYDEEGYVVFETPEMLYPGLESPKIHIGLKGALDHQLKNSSYMIHNDSVQIAIPYNAEGGRRKSFVSGGLFEFYVFQLYMEQLWVDDDDIITRLRLHRTLSTALLPLHVSAQNLTLLEEKLFKVHLGDLPEDVQLVSVQLNGRQFKLPLANTSSFSVSMTEHNDTHGYTLQVAFDDPVVNQQFSKEDSAIHHSLDINYTLVVLPENDSFHHFTSVLALTDVSPPVFTGACSESGVSFKLKHRPFDFLWYVSVGDEALTSELASQYSYTMSNDSSSLQISVPLFTQGYEYKNVTLDGFFGTFEILVRNVETAEVASSTVKTCHFTPKEFIMCSTDGWMTAAADLPFNIPRVGTPPGLHLVDRFCTPKETNGSRALFSFPLNSCGAIVKLNGGMVTYKNEIFLHDPSAEKLATLQCTYPLEGLHRLFSVYRFDSDNVGVGTITHSAPPTGLHIPEVKPTAAPKTTRATKRPNRGRVQPAVYIKVSKLNHQSKVTKGEFSIAAR